MAKKFILRKSGAAGAVPAVPAADGSCGEWSFADGATTHGPMPLAEMKNATAIGGKLRADSLVWRFDTPVRVKAGSLPWLFPDGGAFEDFTAALPPIEPITCPTCRAAFPPEDALFIAHHPSLPHDLVLGPGNPYRFRPARFTPEGAAIDPCGDATTDAACPACHAALVLAAATTAQTRPAPRDKNAPERLPPQLSTTEGVRKLVAEIQSLINRTGSARVLGDVNARQYTELCRRANARLALCQQFIRNHQPAAAFDQAEQPPRLLDLCAALPFADLDQWGQLCARSRWAVPEPVDTDAVAEVQACYAAAGAFEPVFRALRRAVLRSLPEETLRVLRTLFLMDPDNPAWREDLAKFEHARQLALFDAAAAAIEAEDVAALAAPIAELTAPWLMPPDAELLEIVRPELARLRTVDAARRGAAAVTQFSAACTAQDFEAAAAANATLDALHAEKLFQPDEAARRQIEAGRAWFAEARARREADAAFARDVATLETALAAPDAATEVERLLGIIRTSGREAPADLLARADRIVRQRHFRTNLRRRSLLLARAAAAVAVLVLLGALCWHFALSQQRKGFTARLDQALRAGNLAAFDDAVADLSRGVSRLYGTSLTRTPAIEALRARRADLVARIDSRTAAYRDTVAALLLIQTNRFDAPADRVLALLATGKQAARSIPEMRVLENFEEPWRADQNARLAQALAQLAAMAPPAADVFITQPFAAATQQVVRYCTQVDAAAALLGAKPADLEKVSPFVAAAAPGRSNLNVRLAALAGAAQATNLNTYLDVLVRYTDRFTNDTLSARLAAPVLNRRECRTALTATADLRQQVAALAGGDAWTQTRRALLALREVKALNDLRWVRRKDNGEVLLLMDRERAESGAHGKWAECYLPLSGDTAPLFKKLRVTDEPPYNSGIAEQPSRLWHHTEILNEMLARVVPMDRADEGARFVEDLFRRIGTAATWSGSGAPGTNDLPNVAFQIQFLVYLAEQMTRLSPLPEWKLILEELKAADVREANWICLRSGDVKRINQEGVKALARIFDSGGLLARLAARRAAYAQVERTPLAWGGYVDFADPARLHWRTGAPPASFVVFRPDANRVFTVAIDAGAPDQPRLPLVPGEPVLVWADGSATAPKTVELIRAAGVADAAAVAPLLPPWYPREPVK